MVVTRYLDYSEDTNVEYSWEMVFQSTFAGLLIGAFFGVKEAFGFLKIKRRRTFIRTVVLNTLQYISLFVLVIFITSNIGNTLKFALQFLVSATSFCPSF